MTFKGIKWGEGEWPECVTVVSAGQVGKGSYGSGNSPVCAIGWASHDLMGRHNGWITKQSFRMAYVQCFIATGKKVRGMNVCGDNVELINDRMNPATRALLYNAAWAYLGYTEGQSKQAIKLAKKARELNAVRLKGNA